MLQSLFKKSIYFVKGDWEIIFIAGGGISLGIIMMKTGAAKWLAQSIFDALGFATLPLVLVLVLLMFVLQYMHLLFVGTTTMATAFLPIIIGIAQVRGIPPAILALLTGMIIGGYPLLMFYNTLPNILVYGTDKLMVSDFPKVGFIVCTIAVIVYSLCATSIGSGLVYLVKLLALQDFLKGLSCLHVKQIYTSISLSGSSFLSFFSIGKCSANMAPISLIA